MFFTNGISILSSNIFIGYDILDSTCKCTVKWIPILRFNKQHCSFSRNTANGVCWSWDYDS